MFNQPSQSVLAALPQQGQQSTTQNQLHSVNDYLYGGESQPKDTGGSGFLDFLPTLGGIAAPILGAALAPETGGLSLLAGAALSGLGGAAGEAAKDVITNKPVGGDVLTSGIENAVGGSVGGVLGKLGGAIIPKLGELAGKGATSLVKGQAPALPTEVADYFAKSGVPRVDQMRQITPIVTGSEGSLSTGVKGILNEAGDQGITMDLSGLGRSGAGLASDAVNNHAITAGLGENSNLTSNVQDFVQRTLQKYNPDALTQVTGKGKTMVQGFDNGVLNTQSPLNALQITQDLDKRAAEWMSSGSPDVRLQGQALRSLSNEVKDNLYGDNTAIGQLGVPTQVKQQMIDDLAPLKGINSQYYQTKVDEINNARNIAELRSAQRPDVMASQALDAADNAINRSGGSTVREMLPTGGAAGGFAFGGPAGALTGYVAGKALESPTASAAGAGILSKLSSALGSKNASKLVNTLTRSGTIAAANIPSMGAQPANAAGESTTSQLPQGGGANMLPTQTGGGAGTQNQLLNALVAQEILAPSQYGSSAGSVLSSFMPQLQKNQLIQSELAGLPQAYEQAGGAQGFGGIGSVLSSLIPGTAANTYQQRADAAAAQLAQTLGISPQAARGLLPQLMQSPESAGGNLSVLGNLSGALGTL